MALTRREPPNGKFKATYYKPPGRPNLILRERTKTDDEALVAEAFQAAVAKARELGWIVLVQSASVGAPLFEPFPFGLGKMLPFSPNSIPALASAFINTALGRYRSVCLASELSPIHREQH